MSDYKANLLKLYTDYDTILKDLFATLFFDINLSIKDKIEVSDQHLIDDLKSYPEELDLNKTLQRFSWNHYSEELISKQIRNFHFRFSLQDLNKILRGKSFSKSTSIVSRIVRKFEDKYTIASIDQFTFIAREVKRWRNIAFHNDGISNAAQASILQSNINLLLKIYPDELREKIKSIDDFESFITNEFLQSIFYKQNIITASEDIEEITDDKIIQSIEKEQEIAENFESIADRLNHLDSTLNIDVKNPIGSLEKKLTSIESSLTNVTKDIKIFQEKIINMDITGLDENESITATLEPNLSIEELEPDESINEIIYNDNKRKKTNAELKDELLDLRDEIRDEMNREFQEFENWHNILMEPLIKQILLWEIKTKKDFQNDELFKRYYNFEKRGNKIFSDADLKSLKKITKTMMDYQLKEYWPKIKSIVS